MGIRKPKLWFQIFTWRKVILTGWLEKPLAFMNLCDYFICPEGKKKAWVPCCKTMNMKLL